MKFEKNQHREKGVLTDAFNGMVGKFYNEQHFHTEAEKAGFAEARVHMQGAPLDFDRGGRRVNALLDEKGHIQAVVLG